MIFNQYKYNFASKNVSTDEVCWRCDPLHTYNSKLMNEDDILNSHQLRHNRNSCNNTEINRQIVSVS